jgi:hypothetical protein
MRGLIGNRNNPTRSCLSCAKFEIPIVLGAVLALVSCGGGGGAEFGETRFATLELDVAYPVPFSYLSGVRELSDGTMLAADPVSQVLLRLDLEAGTADTIGRKGPGPQEYEGPDHVFPLPGDSTLLMDLGNGRLTVIDPDGTFVDWLPMTRATGDAMPRTIIPGYVDAAGNIYDGGFYSPEAPQDTFSLRRIDRTTWEETEVATAWHTAFARPEPGSKRPMLRLSDEMAVGSDGRIAVVRVHGYSVEWYFPDGRVVKGPPNEVETFPVGTAEKEAQIESFAATATVGRSVVDDDGVQSMQMSRGMTPGSVPGVDDFAWPETLPVLYGGRTQVSPQGEAWVERMMPADRPGRIEIFNEQAIRVGFIELPLHSKVIGFGVSADTVYLARTDDVGLVWLERYRIFRGGDRR